MKNKGFTLAELLGVIVILALISLITVPAVSGVLQKYKAKLCNTQVEQIVSAARTWGSDNILKLPSSGNSIEITLKELSDYGYIDGDIQNPVTKDNFDLEETKVKITKNGKKYEYEINQETLNLCKQND